MQENQQDDLQICIGKNCQIQSKLIKTGAEFRQHQHHNVLSFKEIKALFTQNKDSYILENISLISDDLLQQINNLQEFIKCLVIQFQKDLRLKVEEQLKKFKGMEELIMVFKEDRFNDLPSLQKEFIKLDSIALQLADIQQIKEKSSAIIISIKSQITNVFQGITSGPIKKLQSQRSEPQLLKEQKQDQKKPEQSQQIPNQPSGEIYEMVNPRLARLQSIQAVILSAKSKKAAQEQIDKFIEINDLIHQELVSHLQSLQKQSIGIDVVQGYNSLNLKQPAQQTELLKQQAQQPQQQVSVQQPVRPTLDSAKLNQRAQNLATSFGYNFTIIKALIKEDPKRNDDEIINLLLDQFR